jgi:hypothetical protein
LGRAELTDQVCLEGDARHSCQNGIEGVRVPATAPSRSAGAKRSSPRDLPQGRALSNWSMVKARWNPPSAADAGVALRITLAIKRARRRWRA